MEPSQNQHDKQKRKRTLTKKNYKRISHQDRINVIYSKFVLNTRFKDIAHENDLNYNSVRNIINSFRRTGRTSKKEFKLPQRAKRAKNQQPNMMQNVNSKYKEDKQEEESNMANDDSMSIGENDAADQLNFLQKPIEYEPCPIPTKEGMTSLCLYVDIETEPVIVDDS